MSPDPYETQHGPEYWSAQQEAALNELGFDWDWWLDVVMTRGVAEIRLDRGRGMGYKGDGK